ncbi:MAG: helix-turn-helix transcriptional regulator [Clostridia bacterium]|nr:helix-turn-helix transcriptional regulator [Clostridia bacterium]
MGMRKLRKKRGLSQLKVAMDLHISREAISLYETGKRNPDIQMLLRFSDYFRVSVDYLITGKEYPDK